MASDYFTPPTPNADGETADAADVNNLSDATLTAFELLEAALTGINTVNLAAYTTLAQGWAETAEDVVVPTQPAGSYSALHYSEKASDYASAASTSAGNASTSATTAGNSASTAQTQATAAAASASAAAASAAAALSSQLAAATSASNAASSAATATGATSTCSTYASAAANSASAAESASASAATYYSGIIAAVTALPDTVIADGTGITFSILSGVTTISIDATEIDHDTLLNYSANEHFTLADIPRPAAVQLVGITTDCTAAAFVQIDINADMDGWVLSDLISANSTAGVTGSNIVAAYKNGWTTGTLMATSTVATGVTQSGAVSLESLAARTVAEGDQVTLGITTIHSGTAAKGCNATFTWNG